MENDPWSLFTPPLLSTSELCCHDFDEDELKHMTNLWLEHMAEKLGYVDWFDELQTRSMLPLSGQLLAWTKGEFELENIFCRTIDTKRVKPLAASASWRTHIYHHKTKTQSKKTILFSILPDLLMFCAMHDSLRAQDVYIILCDLDRKQMRVVEKYFQMVCRFQDPKQPPSKAVIQEIYREHTRLQKDLRSKGNLPCLTQLDITFRALLHEKKPPFIILFSPVTDAYSQVIFTDPAFVPDEGIFYDWPRGCGGNNCQLGDECEMIHFPRNGVEGAVVLPSYHSYLQRDIKPMCNWKWCNISLYNEPAEMEDDLAGESARALRCGRCKLVSYCSAEHQKSDWEEHKRLCVKNS